MLMALRIMLLDVLKLRRLPERRVSPIQIPQPAVQGGVPGPDVPNVALEVLHVDDVEADDGGKEADVGFREARAEVVWSL